MNKITKKEVEEAINLIATYVDQECEKDTGMSLKGHKVKTKGVREINGMVKAMTDKAVLISYNDKEGWIPKSTIRNQIEDALGYQLISMDNWIFEKHWG